ncbi:MAG TPA: alpha/beta family hydrolase [Longimicrobiales bacterium]
MSDPLPVTIPGEGGPVSGLLLRPTDARALLVFGHGAGAGMRHPFMEAVSRRLAERGVATLRYQFPYMERRQARTDSPAVAAATVRAACDVARSEAPGLPLVAGGKSFGGRMTSTAQAEAPLPGVRGLIFFGFPLHPPKRPATTRAEHLARVTVPMLFLQGTRDDLADLQLIRGVTGELATATLHVVEGADHSFAVLKRSGRAAGDVLDELVATASSWIDQLPR